MMGRGAGQKYGDIMFNQGWNAQAAPAVLTLTQLQVGITTTVAAYSPKADGWLTSLRLQAANGLVTSNFPSGFVQLVCAQWTPLNTLNFGWLGGPLATAPGQLAGNLGEIKYDLMLPVKTSVPITGNIEFTSPATPVAGIITVMAEFIAVGARAAA